MGRRSGEAPRAMMIRETPFFPYSANTTATSLYYTSINHSSPPAASKQLRAKNVNHRSNAEAYPKSAARVIKEVLLMVQKTSRPSCAAEAHYGQNFIGAKFSASAIIKVHPSPLSPC